MLSPPMLGRRPVLLVVALLLPVFHADAQRTSPRGGDARPRDPALAAVAGFSFTHDAVQAARACVRAGYRTGAAPGAVRCEGWVAPEDPAWARPAFTDLQFCDDGTLCRIDLTWDAETQAHLDLDTVASAIVTTLVGRYGPGRNGDGAPFDPFAAPLEEHPADIATRRIGGLGMVLVRQSCDWARYERRGDANVVEVGFLPPHQTRT